jgi:hypothetical protein
MYNKRRPAVGGLCVICYSTALSYSACRDRRLTDDVAACLLKRHLPIVDPLVITGLDRW